MEGVYKGGCEREAKNSSAWLCVFVLGSFRYEAKCSFGKLHQERSLRGHGADRAIDISSQAGWQCAR